MELRLRHIQNQKDGVEFHLVLIEETDDTCSEILVGTGKRKAQFPYEDSETVMIEVKPAALAYLGLAVLRDHLPPMIRERL